MARTRPFSFSKHALGGRTGEIPVSEIGRPLAVNVMVIEQSLGSWSHVCGVSVMLVVVVVLLFLVLVQGLTKVSDQSRTLEDRDNVNNSLEVYTPNSFIHLFYNSPYMDIVDMHKVIVPPSDSVLREKTMEACYLVGSFPCQFNFISVFDIPV